MRLIMKKTIIFAAFAALVLASACSERVDVPELLGENVISLDFFYGSPATRADGDEEPSTTPGELGENTVQSVQFFLYNDVEEDPVYSSGLINNPTLDENLKYSKTLTAGEGNVPDLTTLFKNGECIVYGVFNVAEEITAAPLATVKETALSNTFAHEGNEAGSSTGSKWVVNLDGSQDNPKYFVMAGEKALVRESGKAYAAKGTVEMNRVAAKISVDLKIKKEVVGKDGNTWVPMLGGSQIRLYPQNVAGAAVLGGADATNPSHPSNLDLFTYKEIVYNSEKNSSYVTDDGTYYVIKSQQDFYTYPMTWTRGSDDEPFIKVIVPWRANSQKEIYYKVMLPVESIESNKYYKWTVVVSVLGTEGEPEVTLEPLSAMVVDWKGGGDINGTVSAAKYLSVERGVKKPVEFYDVSSGTPFSASDPVTLTIKEIKQQNLRTGAWEYLYQNGQPQNSTISARQNLQGETLTVAEVNTWIQKVGNNYLEIGHQLNSDLTSRYMDVTPYYYTAVLSLPNDIDPNHEYDKTVTFVQWPEVYVVADRNSNTPATAELATEGKQGIFINGSNSGTTTWNKGTGRNSWGGTTYDDEYDLGGANGISSNAGNKNPNMYVLTVSVSNTYIIGDPRTASVSMPEFRYRTRSNQPWVNNWAQGRYTEDASVTNHVLTYYHPASSSNTETMIAPKIRVASSYGVCQTGISEEDALLRCATYQEDGIPAGRWRLPTLAEVQFISTLSSLGRIPYLFGYSSNNGQTATDRSAYYWTANGLIQVNNGSNPPIAKEYSGSTPSETTVRCVYDEWFWGDATTRPVSDKTQFTWGDRNY